MNLSAELLAESGEDPKSKPLLPPWRLRPSTAVNPALLTDEEFFEKIDSYFESCAEEERRPLLTELALALGCDSLPQLINDARRFPLRMRAISRAFLAVGVSYEELLASGVSSATFILSKIPSYDSREHPSQTPVYFLKERQEIQMHVTGVEQIAEIGKSLKPRESYLQLIRNRVLEEVQQEKIEDADYIEIPMDEIK
jgi:hypothetical protein